MGLKRVHQVRTRADAYRWLEGLIADLAVLAGDDASDEDEEAGAHETDRA